MTKQDIKNIVMSMKTAENEASIEYFIKRIDNLDDKKFENIVSSFDSNEKLISYISILLNQFTERTKDDKPPFIPINELYSYHISDPTILLHLSEDLMNYVPKNSGAHGVLNTANLYLLDAIDRVLKMRNSGKKEFQDLENLYMISPSLVKPEIDFLKTLGFKTNIYLKSDLKNPDFLLSNAEAMLANQKFGADRNVGTAIISIRTLLSKEWQSKKNQTLNELERKGFSLKDYEIAD